MLAFSLNLSVESVCFAVAAIIVLLGGIFVVISENPVHSALSLVATLFGVALMFIIQGAYFLAAIQVIVYAGAIVVLILFVIMLLGVDRFEVLWGRERKLWRRPLALVAAAAIAVLAAVGALATTTTVTGKHSVSGKLHPDEDVLALGRVLFTKYIWAFEITGILLTVAVVGAVVLARKPEGDVLDLDELPVLEDDEWDDDDGDADLAEVEAEMHQDDVSDESHDADDESVGAEEVSAP
jgi:NADH-quinone oxidoreductase subunit J